MLRPHEAEALLQLASRAAYVAASSLLPTDEELPRVLRPHEAEALLLAKHRPTYCLQILSETLKVR